MARHDPRDHQGSLEPRILVRAIRRGDKRPAVKWKEFQSRRATPDELEGWFGGATNYYVAS